MKLQRALLQHVSRWSRRAAALESTARLAFDRQDWLDEVRLEFTGWSLDKIRAIGHTERDLAKKFDSRRAHRKAVYHLYRAVALRTLASDPTDDVLSELAWQLNEIGHYAEASQIASEVYNRASDGSRRAGETAFKLAIYHFYPGNIAQCRQWLDRVPVADRNDEYAAFDSKVRRSEYALRVLESPPGVGARGDAGPALSDLLGALAEAERRGEGLELGVACLNVGEFLRDSCRLYTESARWFERGSRCLLNAGSWDRGARALECGALARVEAGDVQGAAEVLTSGLNSLQERCAAVPLSRLRGLLACCVSETDTKAALTEITNAAASLRGCSTEEILDWSIAFGRLFTSREQLDLALECLDLGVQRLAREVETYYSERTFALLEDLGRVAYMRGGWTTSLFMVNEARNRAAVNDDRRSVVSALTRAARVYEDAEEPDLAAKMMQLAATLAQKSPPIAHQELSHAASAVLFRTSTPWQRCLHVVLAEHPGSPRFVEALDALRTMNSDLLVATRHGLDVAQERSFANEETGFRVPFLLSAYAVALDRAGRQRDARSLLMAALRLQKRMRNFLECASLAHEYGVACARADRYHTARRSFLIALTYKRRYGSATDQALDSLANFVKASVIVGTPSGLLESVKELERGADRIRTLWTGPEAFDEFSAVLTVAQGYLLLQRTEDAERTFAQAASLLRSSSAAADPLIFAELSALALQLGKSEEAFSYATRGIEEMERGRSRVIGPERREWARYGRAAASAVLEAAYRLGMSHAEYSLQATEVVKIRSLLERFGRDRLPAPPGLPRDLDECDRKIRLHADEVRLRLQSAPEDQRLGLLQKLAGLEQEERELLASFPDSLHDYASLRTGTPPQIGQLMRSRLAAPHTEFVALFPTSDAVFVWHFDGGGQCRSWQRIDIPQAQLLQLATSIQRSNDRGGWASTELDLLVDRILSHVVASSAAGTLWCLIASGALLQLPFAGARLRGTYLAEQHAIALLPAFSVAAYWNDNLEPARAGLVVSDSLTDLPHAREEGALVAKVMACELLTGEEVTLDELTNRLPRSDFLHIACHAEYDSADALNSGILVAKQNRFTCRHALRLTSRSKFAFLSSCESGRISVQAGDELVGLAPALMHTGFDAVIGSLWRVQDHEAKELVARFYERTLRGEDLATSLQGAQLALMSQRATASPRCWAAWQTLGNWRTRLR